MRSLVGFQRDMGLSSIGTCGTSSFCVKLDVWACIGFEMTFLLAYTYENNGSGNGGGVCDLVGNSALVGVGS